MKKLFSSLMAIMACVLVFTACSSDPVSTLKDAVEQANKQMPQTANGVTMKSISFDEASKTVTYVCEMPQAAFAQMQTVAAAPNYKDVVIYSMKDDQSVKDLAKLIVAAKGNLKFQYGYAGGSETIDLVYDTATLQKLIDGTLPAAQLQQPAQPAEETGAEEPTEEDAAAVEGEEPTEEDAAAEEGYAEDGSEEVAE